MQEKRAAHNSVLAILPCQFICQVDIYETFNDDCRLYVFCDQGERKVKYVYQRT